MTLTRNPRGARRGRASRGVLGAIAVQPGDAFFARTMFVFRTNTSPPWPTPSFARSSETRQSAESETVYAFRDHLTSSIA